jgi:hypothetical protein
MQSLSTHTVLAPPTAPLTFSILPTTTTPNPQPFFQNRYKNFLGLNNPNDFMAAAAAMKKQGDFTSLRDDAQAIAAVRSEGMAADKVLAINTVEEGAAAARWVARLGRTEQQHSHQQLVLLTWVTLQ